MTDITSQLVAPGRLLPGIHGMRGAAALAILIFHTFHIAGTSAPFGLGFASKYFGYSVHLFFVVSAFSLMYSTLPTKSREAWIQNYLIKRFFRIAPLFYFLLAVMIGGALFFRKPLPNLSEIITNLTFTFGLVPPYTGGLVWGSWAIGVEVIFYAIFPVLLVCCSNLRVSLLFLIVATLVSFSIGSTLHEQHLSATPRPRWDPSYFAFGSNCLFFAFGIWAFYLRDLVKSSVTLLRIARLFPLILLGGLLFCDLASYLRPYGRLDLVAWGLCFALLCAVESLTPSMVMANRVMEYFGERSFSIYLVHPPVLIFAKTGLEALRSQALPCLGPTVTAITELAIAIIIILPLAEITYRLIEVRGINLGKAVIKSMSAKRRGDNLVSS